LKRIQSDLTESHQQLRNGLSRCRLELTDLEEEQKVWEAENVTVGSDGMLLKGGEGGEEEEEGILSFGDKVFLDHLEGFTGVVEETVGKLNAEVQGTEQNLQALVTWLGEPSSTHHSEVLQCLWDWARDFDQALLRIVMQT